MTSSNKWIVENLEIKDNADGEYNEIAVHLQSTTRAKSKLVVGQLFAKAELTPVELANRLHSLANRLRDYAE